jgi:hypothetical protein
MLSSIHCAFVTTDASRLEEEAQRTAKLRALSDETLVAMLRRPDLLEETYPGELQRRLMAALREFKSSSDTASKRLSRLTWVLIVLTVIIAVLTGVLVWIELAH